MQKIRTDNRTRKWSLLYKLSIFGDFDFFLSFFTPPVYGNTFLGITAILLCLACIGFSIFCCNKMNTAHEQYLAENPLSDEETLQVMKNRNAFVDRNRIMVLLQTIYGPGFIVLNIFMSFSQPMKEKIISLILAALLLFAFRNTVMK